MRAILPDGTIMEVENADELNELVQRYESQGYEVLRQGDDIVITSKPKQA